MEKWTPGMRAAYLYKRAGTRRYVPALIVSVNGHRVKIQFRVRLGPRQRPGAIYLRELITAQDLERLVPENDRFVLSEQQRERALAWHASAGIVPQEDDLWLFSDGLPE